MSSQVAEGALADLVDPNLGAEDTPQRIAERDAQIRKLYNIARPQGGAITFEPKDEAAARPTSQPVVTAAPQQQAANDPITAALLREANPANRPGMAEVPGSQEHEAKRAEQDAAWRAEAKKNAASSWNPLGGPEALLTAGSGFLANVAGRAATLAQKAAGVDDAQAVARAKEIMHSLTYEPRLESTKDVLGAVSSVAQSEPIHRLAGLGPAEGMALAGASAGPAAVRVAPRAAAATEAAPARVPGQMASVGASAVAPAEQAKVLAATAQTPEIRQAIERAASKPMTPFSLKTVERHVEADTLPVPIKLTSGQATQDATLLSQEQNARGSKPELVQRFNEQESQLRENLHAIREKAAPDVYATSKPSMGETIIDAYKAKDAALNKTISANYKALKDANGGEFPMDAKAFVNAADAKLHKELKFEFVPGPLERQLQAFREGRPMNFEQFEAMRTNLANIQRSQTDGNVKRAAAIIRDALEELPMPTGAEHLKPLADQARASARERFALMDADPAYKAIVKGKASADQFIDRYVLGPKADVKHLETMKANLAHDPVAQQTMTAGAMRRLKDKAGDNFSQAGYNKAVEGLQPKMSILFDPESKALVEKLGNVARYVKGQPTGSFVNNSNTAVAMLGTVGKFAGKTGLNAAFPGFQVGDKLAGVASFIKEKKNLSQSLQTGAGIGLKEVSK